MTVTQFDLFYETRASVYVNNSNPGLSSNSNLTNPPTAAEIRFDGEPNRFIDAEQFEAPNDKGYKTAIFLIERAMLDPTATVVPQE